MCFILLQIKKMKESFSVFYENDESEKMLIEDIFYLIKNYRLIEITLDNWYAIRQWKDLPMVIERDWETFNMEYWKVYCCSWNVIESVWNWWGEDELKDYIETCSKYI